MNAPAPVGSLILIAFIQMGVFPILTAKTTEPVFIWDSINLNAFAQQDIMAHFVR